MIHCSLLVNVLLCVPRNDMCKYFHQSTTSMITEQQIDTRVKK